MSGLPSSATVKCMLPFRVESINLGGKPYLSLHYDQVVIDTNHKTRTVPCRQDLGFPEAPASALGAAIYKLMQLFWEMESSVATITKDREELAEAQRQQALEIKSLRGKVDELQRRVATMTKKG